MNAVLHAFRPNRAVSRTAGLAIVAGWLSLVLAFWFSKPFALIPTPGDVLGAFGTLWRDGAFYQLLISLWLNAKALCIATIVSLGIAYATVLPAMRPFAEAVSKLRFLGLTGLTVIFTFAIDGSEARKIAIMVFGISVYFVPAMVAVIQEIPKDRFDDARTMRLSEWGVVRRVVIMGTRDQALELVRQNAAISWMMLTMVEGLIRSGGGIGTVLVDQNKHFHLSAVFAIQFMILGIGLLCDWAIGVIRNLACPYAAIGKERK